MASIWNPWRGCHRHSDGCKYCYIHKGDAKRGVDTGRVEKADKFGWPVRRNKKGEYSVKPGQTVFLCFTSDFLVEDADDWRGECWDMMRERSDLHFLFLTKRIERFMDCVPPDWGGGWDNVTVGCTVENQQRADERLSLFATLPIKHKNIICQPLIEQIDISSYLKGIELVVVGGESDRNARPLDYAWVLDIRRQCIEAGVLFEFRQCGTHFIKDGKEYTLQVKDLGAQARKANINT
ncbi:phage Gp37/Gp68 family protein [Ruminococcaceae bacterium OttesenSCG-928-D13]|nr:phage Gp37/Gp68 family protein [Ruminococcaceae bacterium OttesenSCG-928-D13]